MFKQKCFIRKNTPELVDKLSLLGGRSGAVFFDEKYNTLAVEEIFFRCVADNTADTLIKQGFIDCGTNDELFLAIAALRDDDCYMQYYWFDGKLLKCKGTGSTVKMNGDYSIKLITLGNSYIDVMIGNVRKATVQELIEHFNK